MTVPLNYFIKCYINDKEIYVQCGESIAERTLIIRPEMSSYERKCFKVTDTEKGGDAVSSMASSLAGGSILFKDKNPNYANRLLEIAIKMYTYAEAY